MERFGSTALVSRGFWDSTGHRSERRPTASTSTRYLAHSVAQPSGKSVRFSFCTLQSPKRFRQQGFSASTTKITCDGGLASRFAKNAGAKSSAPPKKSGPRYEWIIRPCGDYAQSGHTWVLPENGSVRVGRVDDSVDSDDQEYMITLKPLEVSRKHARFEVDNGTVWLRDLRSCNGTWRGRNKLRPGGRTKVQKGDIISFGGRTDCTFRLQRRPKKTSQKRIVTERPQELEETAQQEISDTAALKAQDKPQATLDAAQQEAPEAVPQQNAGNPYGKKVLGKAALKWLTKGIRAAAEEWVYREEVAASGAHVEEVLDLYSWMQPFLDKSPLPSGQDAAEKCEMARLHAPTLWDNLQREVQEVVRRKFPDDWAQHPAWKKMKSKPKSAVHREAVRAGVNGVNGNDVVALLKSEQLLVRAVSYLETHVAEMRELLVLERNAEVAILRPQGLPAPCSPEDDECEVDVLLEGVYAPLVEAGSALAESEAVAVIGPLQMVGSGQTPGGGFLLLLRFQGLAMPLSRISPGCAVALCSDGLCVTDFASSTSSSVGKVFQMTDDTVSVEMSFTMQESDMVELLPKTWQLHLVPDSTSHDRQLQALQSLLTTMKVALKGTRRALRTESTLDVPLATAIVATVFGDPELSDDQPVEAAGGVLDSHKEALDLLRKACLESGEKQRKGPRKLGRAVSPQGAQGTGATSLDEDQLEAVRHALDEENAVAVIQGPPGTGKTGVLTQLVEEAVANGLRILATAPSNAAVDNMVERFHERGIKVVRVGNPERMTPAVMPYTLSSQVEANTLNERLDLQDDKAYLRHQSRKFHEQRAEVRKLLRGLQREERRIMRAAEEEILAQAEVVLCTLVGAGSRELANLSFDLAVVDEAGQATQPSTWIPLLKCRRAVLAGDSKQLPPTILSSTASTKGLDESLLERTELLQRGSLARALLTQYRMHPCISGWASREMYDGRLRSAPGTAARTLDELESVEGNALTRTPLLLLDTRLPSGTLLPGCFEEVGQSEDGGALNFSMMNLGEARLVAVHVARLIQAGVPASLIAVQSPYKAQVALIREILAVTPGAEEVEVASVDSFQGREAEVVVISMVRSNPRGTIGFLSDARRLNVAVTRARRNVTCVCDSQTVQSNPVLSRFLQHIVQEGVIMRADADPMIKLMADEPMVVDAS